MLSRTKVITTAVSIALLAAGCAGNVEPRLAYVASRGVSDEVYLFDRTEETTEQLTFTGGDKTSPAFSSDGEWVFFASDADGDWDIYRVPVDGGEVEKLTHNLIDDRFPAPVSWKEGVVYLAYDSDGPVLRVLTEPGVSPALDVNTELYNGVVDARWDQRGNFLALTVEAERHPGEAASSGRDIWRYDHGVKLFDGLVEDHADNIQPSWSRDARWLVFASNRGGVVHPDSPEGLGDYDLFLYNVDNGGLHRLTNEPGDELFPIVETDNESVLFYAELEAGPGIYRRLGTSATGRIELLAPVEGELRGLAVFP
jgi:tricorn protease-like protein